MTGHGTSAGNGAPTLRVIGAGFGRTGTLSLRAALVRLGFGPCDHMQENFDRPERFVLWLDAYQRKQQGKPIDWRPLLDGYQAIVDWPGAAFWQELAAAHPDARIILTVRDPDRWYDSVRATIYRVRAWRDRSLAGRAFLAALAALFPPLRRGLRVADAIIWDGTFSGQFADREQALAMVAAHQRAVQDALDPERLLVLDVRDGWEPLCAFLGVPVPVGEPFPHLNDAGSFHQHVQECVAAMALRDAGAVVAPVVRLAARWLIKRPR